MTINKTQNGKELTLALAGRLDTTTAPELEAELNTALDNVDALTLDFNKLDYEAAERYLNAVMNGKTSIPLKAWKAERDKLNGEKKELTRQYYALKDEVKEVEQIRKNVYSILREETGREQPTRKREIDR